MAMKKNKPSFSMGAVLFAIGVVLCVTGAGVIVGVPLIVIGCVIMAGV